MNLTQLEAELRRRRVEPSYYQLGADRSGHVAEGAVYVCSTAAGWEVGIRERGELEPLSTFDDEAAACDFALAQLVGPALRADRPRWLRWI